MKNLTVILDQSKQSIDVNNKLQPTGTLTKTFQNPVGNQICMLNLDTAHKQFIITPRDKYQYQ